MKLPISSRLLACANFVSRGDRVADIGCDHGYLTIHLLLDGIAKSCIASDVNQGPLQSAMRNARKFGVHNKIQFFLSDGVQNIPRDFDCMVCAGMGADTMIHILDSAPWLQSAQYRLILQCQSRRPELRQWLYDAGYRINRETLVKDGRFIYTVMEVVWGPGEGPTPAETYISPQLIADAHPLLPEYYERVKEGVELTVMGLARSGDERLPVYQDILADLNAMEEQIYGNRS